MAKTYLITAATGIGAETARILAGSSDENAPVNIFFSSLSKDPCHALKNELECMGANADFFCGDLTDPACAEQLTNACVERFTHIDALFNVAGSSGRRFGDGPIHKCTEEGWQQTIATNLTTQFRMCHHVVKHMLSNSATELHSGTILNMSSILALHPEPSHFDTVAYATSKGGVLAMTRSMAASYAGKGIRVNAILPSLVHTPMSSRAAEDPDIVAFVQQKQRLTNGVMPVAEVASTCAFLLTGASGSITGQWLEVDGGWGL